MNEKVKLPAELVLAGPSGTLPKPQPGWDRPTRIPFDAANFAKGALPSCPPEAPGRAEADSTANEEKPDARQLRILVVEDDVHIRETIKDRLEFEGFAVITADNGATALALARTAKPDLITLDIMLPGGMDGTEVGAALKKYEGTKNIPIIYATCLMTREEERMMGRERAGEVIMAKPFNFDELVDVIKKQIGA